jgi:hypothetical protein
MTHTVSQKARSFPSADLLPVVLQEEVQPRGIHQILAPQQHRQPPAFGQRTAPSQIENLTYQEPKSLPMRKKPSFDSKHLTGASRAVVSFTPKCIDKATPNISQPNKFVSVKGRVENHNTNTHKKPRTSHPRLSQQMMSDSPHRNGLFVTRAPQLNRARSNVTESHTAHGLVLQGHHRTGRARSQNRGGVLIMISR